jgi:exosortase
MQKSQVFPLQVTVLVISFLALFYPTVVGLIRDWSDPNFSHGYLVPFVSGYMVWQRKDLILWSGSKSSYWGLLVLAGGILLHMAGRIGAEHFTQNVSMILTLWALGFYLLGWSAARRLAVPCLYLLFMVPVPAILWNQISFPMQLLASKWAVAAIGLLNIPVLREGNAIHLAGTTLEVVDACSGLRSLTSLLALSAAFAYVSPLRKTAKWVLFLSAAPVAIGANILRLTTTAVLVQVKGPAVALGFLHDVSGVVVFVFGFVLIVLLNLVLSRFSRAE